ncbi:hypothetical protein [Thiobacillus sedimenti]|uniref:Glycosyl hydrolase n=1 Tax=Thiobacillus sedimenti TaxID=3110231 RepID=A0ABZ1CJR8_9PROT|nr:hypothetical protein [Thiobacillus sp. SCUT-2]WRS39631.1 hypothetical protein VA613_01815 [Thiobacillus sp. SCUT-2]
MSFVAAGLAMLLLLWLATLLAFAVPLVARWREPVLKCPVLIIESDDWGAGPLRQADLLGRLAALLQRIRDRTGRPAAMTLGVVLAVPDGARIAASGCSAYHELSLADGRFEGVRAAMQAGMQAGVFAPQLHGQCHYWPPALMAAARGDAGVRAWLGAAEPAMTEELPSPLQSRWIDASRLPSRALDAATIGQAVAAEAAAYGSLFGAPPRVAVATTFVWNEVVERAWAEAGVEVVVTPGRRATCRNAAGQPDGIDATMLSGSRSGAGQTYLVRDAYFEPSLGHGAQRLADSLTARTRQGRACLAETHRFNFLRAEAASLAALEAALQGALTACPGLRFLFPLELAHALRTRDPAWVETRLRPRLAAWCARLDEIPRFARAARLTGLALPLGWLGRAA